MFFVKWIFRILPFAYMVAVWVMSSMPSNAVVELPILSVDRFIKESLHLVEFAILFWLFVAAWLTLGADEGEGAGTGSGTGAKTRQRVSFTARVSLILAIVAGAYGIVDEIHQSFVPYRSATVIDAVKDWTGVLVSLYLVRVAYFGDGTRFVRLRKVLKGFEGMFVRVRG
ncbi:VanZ family protein [Bacillus sp. DNRA2]|uniref:VanZ family protein n=1 Tax=Bacillus sp. DNRA2 TaxID=2723053 RepID=UPI00145DE192|nr:VanZ family protein [Bacillus sp. DNRA2]NMD70101.1 VanZ family protein [Bacillus sp. DNRA2]